MIIEKLAAEFEGTHPLNTMTRYHLQSGGKCLRGRLALTEALELKVPAAQAMLWALACELLHNATLIHDDIQDNDPVRRGRPSLWKKFGVAHAINTGDLLIFRAFKLTAQLQSSQLTELLATTAEALVQGQSDELVQIACNDNNYWNSYLEMTRLKTGALFQLPVHGIHILANKNQNFSQASAWLDLGACYQITDDVRDYLGLKQTGQQQKDFTERRINAVVAWLSKDPTHKNLIHDYIHIPPGTNEHLSVIKKITDVVDSDDTLLSLQEFAKLKLEEFKQSTTPQTQSIILDFLDTATQKGMNQHEQNH